MYQGGLCCLLITMMTICVGNQVSGPEAELTKHQQSNHGKNGVHETMHSGSHHNNNNKGHGSVKKKEEIIVTSKFCFCLFYNNLIIINKHQIHTRIYHLTI